MHPTVDLKRLQVAAGVLLVVNLAVVTLTGASASTWAQPCGSRCGRLAPTYGAYRCILWGTGGWIVRFPRGWEGAVRQPPPGR